MKHSAPQSAKFRKFVRILRPLIDCDLVSIETVAVGILERLWHVTIVSAPQGDIGRIEDEVLAELVGWHGDPSVLITAMVDSGFVDVCSVYRLVIHDWPDHAPGFIKGNLKKHNRAFIEVCQPEIAKPNQTQLNQTQPNSRKPGQQTATQPAEQCAKQTKVHWFELFWSAFPSGRKSGKQASRKVWDVAIRTTPAQTIIDAAVEYAASDVGQGEFVKSPASWLNQGCWDDDREAWRNKRSTQQTFSEKKTSNTLNAVTRFMDTDSQGRQTNGQEKICN